MPHFPLGNSLFFGSRSRSSGDHSQDVSLCNRRDLGALWPISPRSAASLSLSLPLSAPVWPSRPQRRLPQMPSFSLGRALTPGVPSQLGPPHALQAPCFTPVSPLFHPCLKTQVVSFDLRPAHPDSANLPLPQAPSFTACARARTRRFSSSRGSAASARSSAIRE